MGRRQQAEAAFRLVLDSEPTNARAFLGLAQSLDDAHAQKAFDCFRSAADLEPGLADAHNGLGCLSPDPASAQPHFARAVELEPTCAEFRSNLAMCLLEQGKLAEAETELEDAVAMGAGPAVALALAEVLFDTGRLADADRILRPIVTGVEIDGQFHREAWRHYENLDFAAAEECFASCKPSEDDVLWAWVFALYGKILMATEREWPATRCFRTAIRLQPRAAEYHKLLSEALLAQRLSLKAGAAMRRARELERALRE